MNLSSLLALAGGAIGLATASNWTEGLSSGAAIVSGVAGATGHSDVAKIAGVAALGGAAYDMFGGGGPATTDAGTSSAGGGSIASALSGDRGNANVTPDLSAGPDDGSNARDQLLARGDATGGASVGPAAAATPSLASTSVSNTVTKPMSLMDMAKGASGFLKDNKELLNLGGTALSSMYGPQAQQASLLKQKLAADQAEIDRRRTNANNLAGLRIPVTGG